MYHSRVMSLENMRNCQMNGFQDDDLSFMHNAFIIDTCGKIQINSNYSKGPPCNQVPITTKVVSLNPVHGKVYSIQHYVIKFVSDLRQVGGFLWVLLFPPPIKLTAMI